MNKELYEYYKKLANEDYEAHPFYTLQNILNDGKKSDCQDRSYDLAKKARELGLKPKFLWLGWWKQKITSHVCVLIDNRVWDATWTLNNKHDYWDYPLDLYLKDANPDFKIITPYWVRKVIK